LRIKNVRIQNYRCIQDLTIDFDTVTSLIGPNDAGKSSVLRILDWFFNGITKDLTSDDLSSFSAEGSAIEIEVVFGSLEQEDFEAFGEQYLPPDAKIFRIRRVWQDGNEDAICTVRSYELFTQIRDTNTAKAFKEAYERVRREHPSLELPEAPTRAGGERALVEWESHNQELLDERPVNAQPLFGTKGILRTRFMYAFLGVDMRTQAETADARGTLLSRITATIDRSAAETELEDLYEQYRRREDAILTKLIKPQTVTVNDALTSEIAAIRAGRGIRIEAGATRARTSIQLGIHVSDGVRLSPLGLEGHGLQRAALLAGLLVASGDAGEGRQGPAVMLAIEEPESYQHPAQSRQLARVLRERAERSGSRLAVCYATHSPIFVSPAHVEQVRRLNRTYQSQVGFAPAKVLSFSKARLRADLEGANLRPETLQAQIDAVFSEPFVDSLFAAGVVLVEGDTDKVVIEELAAKSEALECFGVTVASAHGKGNLVVAHAILSQLGIPAMTVFDSDSGNVDRLRKRGRSQQDIEREDRKNSNLNRAILEYHGIVNLTDYPVGVQSTKLVAWDDNLEQVLEDTWPAWTATFESLLAELGEGKTKRAAVYRLTARRCEGQPSQILTQVITMARALSGL
jgi:putative ATP-dependent endonuclease of the OLD family